ncbi:hypothetical protein DQ354_19140 [Arthrobacter sp. AQ5-06]|nr:hypothetical protein DQ354_19140 [Arthrobacter sp. AQ5-06]
MDEEVRNAISAFTEPLPSGVDWFQGTPDSLKKADTQYEEGVAEGEVAFYWLCAWEKSYLVAFEKSEDEGQIKSLNMIEKFPELPWYKAHMQDPQKGWIKAVVTPAKLGDPSGLKKEFASACSHLSL